MTWGEFSTLLAGIGPKTPLGQIVSIRSEEDKEMLKYFTPEQHKIRNEWRSKMAEMQQREFNKMSDAEKAEKVKQLQEALAKAFS